MPSIAIIGSGISGLSLAEMLRTRQNVTVLEAEPRAGGHARTLSCAGTQVDTGFIVYNEVNYPLLTAFFAHLGIATKPSDMSFGVRIGEGGGETSFCGSSLNGLFADRRNLLSCSHWSMLADTLRFFRAARRVLDAADDPTLGEFLDRLKLGIPFRERFLIPMGAAIWSTPAAKMLDFPAKAFVRFFDNHGLLSVKGHHPWRTVKGGSRVYVERIGERLGERLRLGASVERVEAKADGVTVTTRQGTQRFDHAVFACHADEALRLIAQPTNIEADILGSFQFQDNLAVLHRDSRLMPRAKAAWASWVYAAGGAGETQRVSVTYWMNRLQGLGSGDLFVTLNPDREIAPSLVLDRHTFRHPLFSQRAIEAQARLGDIQGKRGLWFCGAWQRNGFHEDGIWSATRVARAFGYEGKWP